MDLLISSAALFLLAHFLSSPSEATVAPQGASITAQWSADLRAAVGSEPLGMVVGRGRETHGRPYTSLRFLDKGTIVATFVTREGNPTLSGRDNPDSNQPLRLRAIFFDADTGKITSTQAWPTESRVAGIVAANDGSFVTQRGDILTHYSLDARERSKLSLPPVQEEQWGWSWHAQASPTGRNILFVSPNQTTTSATPWIWVDSNSLQIAYSWKGVRSGWVGISDNTIAMSACSFWIYHCDPNVEIRGLTTEWKTIAPIEKRSQPIPQFVNEDTIFLSGHPWRLLQTDGKVILTENAPFEGDTAISSAGGQRFVVPFFQSKGGVTALDIGAHGELKTISIYDAPFHERSYRLEVKAHKIKEQARLALSPDGAKLAVLYEESVYVFQLPPAPTPPPSIRTGVDAQQVK
jgi:hypothetical protein